MREHLCGQTVCVCVSPSICLSVSLYDVHTILVHTVMLIFSWGSSLSVYLTFNCVSVGLCKSLFVAPYPLSSGGWGWGGVGWSAAELKEWSQLHCSPLFSFCLYFHPPVSSSLSLSFIIFFCSSSFLLFFYYFAFLFTSSLFPFLFVLFWFFLSSVFFSHLWPHYPLHVISTLICPLVFIIYSLFLSSLLLSLC